MVDKNRVNGAGRGCCISVSPRLSGKGEESVLADEIQEPALMIVIQVSEIVAEVREVVTHADLEMLAKVTVNGCQHA